MSETILVPRHKQFKEPAKDKTTSRPNLWPVRFYIVDLRREWRSQKYITFWRANNANYSWPVSWAGRYSLETINAKPDYYWQRGTRSWERFPIPCHILERLPLTEPDHGDIDGDAGPVLLNTRHIRRWIRRYAQKPPGME